MESTFKCPSCGKQTIGVVATGCAATCICPFCKQLGNVVYMLEERKETIRKMGDGLYVKETDR
jgi:transcription elongation factor Elf1